MQEIRKISKGIGNLPWFYVSGGEPFLRKDIDIICSTFYKQNRSKRIVVPTNGFTPKTIKSKTRQIAKKCEKASIGICVSLDGFQETHEFLRGVSGCYDKVLETIYSLNVLKDSLPNLSVTVNTVICNHNYKEIPEFMEFVLDELKPDFHSLEPMRGNPKDPALKPPNSAKTRNIFEIYSKSAVNYFRERDSREYSQHNSYNDAKVAEKAY